MLPDDFLLIEELQCELTKGLATYEKQFEEMRKMVVDSSSKIQAIKNEIQQRKHRYIKFCVAVLTFCVSISSNQMCIHCNQSLTLEKFTVFPCHHTFHTRCMRDLYQEYVDSIETSSPKTENTSSSKSSLLDSLKTCPLCGECMIENIDKPLSPLQPVLWDL